MESKPFWASKTLWVNFVAMVAAITGALGIDLGLDPDTQLALVGGVMAVINIVLRFLTTKPVIETE